MRCTPVCFSGGFAVKNTGGITVAIEIDEEGFAVESEEPEFDHLDESAVYNIQIKVFGVGGGGAAGVSVHLLLQPRV